MEFEQLSATKQLVIAASRKQPADAIRTLYEILAALSSSSTSEAIVIKEMAIETLSCIWDTADNRKTWLKAFFSKLPNERYVKFLYGSDLISLLECQMWMEQLPRSLFKEIARWTSTGTHRLDCELFLARLADSLSECRKRAVKQRVQLDLDLIIDKVRIEEQAHLDFQFALQRSILHTALGNVPNAKAALQVAIDVATFKNEKAAIDLQRGILCMENDQYEANKILNKAFGAFYYFGAPQALYTLKLLLMCNCKMEMDVNKCVLDVISEYVALIEDTIAHPEGFMKTLENKVLTLMHKLRKYPPVQKHISEMSDRTTNLIIRRLIEIECGWKLEIVKVADRVGCSYPQMLDRISHMISSEKLEGKVDEESACLIRYIESWTNPRFERDLSIHSLDFRHDILFAKAEYCLLNDEDKCKCVPDVWAQCGTKSCFAFVLVDALYAAGYLEKHPDLQRGSVQELLDVLYPSDIPYDNTSWRGKGASFLKAFKYINEYGLATEEDLPFEGKCLTAGDVKSVGRRKEYITSIQKQKKRIFVRRRMLIERVAMVKAQLHKGPVMAAITTSDKFKDWKPWHGILTREETDTKDKKKVPDTKDKEKVPGHGILLVGYGNEDDGSKYFIAKNSWGKEWGHRGYIKVATDVCRNFRTVSGYGTRMVE